MNLIGRVALVTGGSRGIGRATALQLAKRGADVALLYLKDADSAEQVVTEIESLGRRGVAVRGDVAERDTFERLRDELTSSFGQVDILINNAGAILQPPAWDASGGDVTARTININLLSVINAIEVFAPPMVRSGWGRIVNITTTYSFNGSAPVLAYTAAKAGVNAVTTAMAAELGPSGVLVNAVAPGNVDTDMTRAAGKDVVDWAVGTTPVGRLGAPEEIAESVGFLVESDFICGHVLVVDGGQLLRI
ncbi:SDR family NAD(P)-dependent oxidoreductase [Saccharopolyspora sp. 5N708]|uniref:SDR family NAD(P)-dependent oxidoreductase n=1 Tax=Saccharopolyspora sp. 5N708 TaxID=3457424 RepID=UPI003FD2AFEA